MKNFFRASSTVIAFASMLASLPAFAQTAYPEKCKSGAAASGDMAMKDHENSMPEMTDYQKESMEGMKTMGMNMMQGMMKKDPDVSFVCGMIAHHMGAISMAQVELKHGDNAEAKANAQKIIDAQTKEIEEMTAWVEKEVK
ncbi:hypothetical protein AGRO_2075 [Agrobacterium sp. ATCC 31749]|uniref:DUF305 domain-containing protein n=1 Tax=Agrobacterium TaxID=357 RepID=UPI00020DBECE|nr:MULTISPECIES: DUF305 domain-containing protein [Agrobacterium]EGL65131.1 hypothetical protein AGRO_2075 [Agrobacterium sp. ATCC 31749]MEA1844775.1 DUF305 domain-containing protein [Agrobacterium tumefaciens]QKX00543.1 DUF305 domain-containing protein [Agrobacterium sp. CGMCC 11546]UXT84868.1 DUF305 domain-containing protein [Agrobacterium tumefaciens]